MQPKSLIMAAFLLAACDEAPADSCGADGYQALVGQPLAAVSLPAGLNLRVIEPGMMVTMDHVPGRLNFRLDEDGRIVSVTCG